MVYSDGEQSVEDQRWVVGVGSGVVVVVGERHEVFFFQSIATSQKVTCIALYVLWCVGVVVCVRCVRIKFTKKSQTSKKEGSELCMTNKVRWVCVCSLRWQ